MRRTTRSHRGHNLSARIKPALFVALIFAAALALTGSAVFSRIVPGLTAASAASKSRKPAPQQGWSSAAKDAPGNALPSFANLTSTVFINEIHYDNSGADTNEGVEVAGPAGTDLTGWTIVPYNGSTPTAAVTYTPIGTLSGTIPNQQNGYGTVYVGITGLQNGGNDGVALVNNSNQVIQLLSYEGVFTAATGTTGGPAAGMTSTDIGVSQGGTQSDAFTLQLQGTGGKYGDFTWGAGVAATRGAVNTGQTFTPTLFINDVTQAEGNADTTAFTFTVTLSTNSHSGVSFDICTADGTAQDDNPTTEDNDYAANCLTGANIPGGQSFYNFTVNVNGDTLVEATETFFVNVTNVTGSTVADGQGRGTIQNDDSSDISINDVSQDEGSGGGTTAFTFTVTLSQASLQDVTVDYVTANGTTNPATGGADCNTAGVDYISTSGTLTFAPADTSEQITVQVCADAAEEPNETFFVNLSNQSANATITDAQGVGTIVHDDFVITLISVIQGSTPSGNAPSPRLNETHTVRGIVTLLKSNGFFIQEEVGDNDSDPNTSEGVFVFTNAAPTVAVGTLARVTGTVVEFNGLTEISTTNVNVATVNTGNSPPTAVTLTAADLPPTADRTQPQLEKYEGMRVFAPSLTTVAPNNNFFEVPTVITGVPRPLREPGIPAGDPIPPDPTTGTPDCCIPIFDRNPERILVDTNDRAGSTGEVFTSNVVITNLAGPLDYAFGAYRIINEANITRGPGAIPSPTSTPTPPPNATANMSAVPVPTPVATEFTVAGFNIENFNNATAAGQTQRQKAALGIVRVMRLPDIIGHAEIFNLASLEALATEVNTRAVADGHPNPMYEARLIPTPVGGITQNVGFLVKTSRVRIDSVTQERTSSTYIQPTTGDPDETHDRPPLVLRATIDPSGVNKPVIVVVNHTRSFNDVEQVAGAGLNARAKRKAQAEDLADLFQDLQTDNPGVAVIGVGDYNAFQFSSGYDDPIAVIKGNPTPDEQIVVDGSPDLVNPNYFNLIDELPAAEQYSFIFDNTPQALDHVLVNTAAHNINTRIAIARMNADFPEVPASAFASDATRPERNSDHDAPVAYFTLFEEAKAGQLLISEFRHFGPGGAEDEFIEIYNNTDVEHVVAATDGSAGYSVATAADETAGTPRCVITSGTRIPARGYFLCANSDGYSLADHPSGTSRNATADQPFTADIPADAGLALFSTANTANYGTDTRLDAAGPSSEANTLYKEGSVGYPALTTTTARQYSFFRNLRSGRPKDTNDNAADFLYVNTEGTDEGAGGRLGAPGPQNLSSPIQHNVLIKASLIDPSCGTAEVGMAAANPNPGQSPDGTPVSGCQNTVRDGTPLATQPDTSAAGSFYIRRRFRNGSNQNVTRLRFRVVDVTTKAEMGTADLRLLSSGATQYTVNATLMPLHGLALEEPPAQAIGGGFNSTLQCCTGAGSVNGARAITLAEPLAPNGTIDVQFRFGVMAPGFYRFFVNIEAELQPAVTPVPPSKAGAQQIKR